MENKITIDGKEYTQRSISNLEIDGRKIDGNIINPIDLNNGNSLNVTINLSDMGNESEIQKLKINEVNDEIVSKNEDSIFKRFIYFIKGVFSK